MDAVDFTGGWVDLAIHCNARGTGCIIECRDNGAGIPDMENLRTVFWTSKKDSRLKRGRMGRGFKEMLCLCTSCSVQSGDTSAEFTRDDSGRQVFKISALSSRQDGTTVKMDMPWSFDETKKALQKYFSVFQAPKNMDLTVLGEKIPHTAPVHTVPAVLPTEEFCGGKWARPQRKTTIEMSRCRPGEAMIFEMGIPICSLEWDLGLHANIMQRVPMNPNRDATMSGYVAKIHRACLPHILAEMPADSVRAAWVGEAASALSSPELQKEVLRRAFGENLARSVPDFGKFSHDADAQESCGSRILDTKQLTGGFRELARAHVPTSATVSKTHRVQRQVASASALSVQEARHRHKRLISKLGMSRVETVCGFHRWLAAGILDILSPGLGSSCKVKVADFAGRAEATWTDQMQTLTLALDLDRIWLTPLHPENFSLLVHETAHELAAHHGRSFSTALETAAGAACHVIFSNALEIEKWRGQLSSLPPLPPSETSPSKRSSPSRPSMRK
jgi:hypothetical protein